jgi:hypothetical protein
MRYAEIVPRNQSHYVIVDGAEWLRHDDLAIAFAVRQELVREEVEWLELRLSGRYK